MFFSAYDLTQPDRDGTHARFGHDDSTINIVMAIIIIIIIIIIRNSPGDAHIVVTSAAICHRPGTSFSFAV